MYLFIVAEGNLDRFHNLINTEGVTSFYWALSHNQSKSEPKSLLSDTPIDKPEEQSYKSDLSLLPVYVTPFDKGLSFKENEAKNARSLNNFAKSMSFNYSSYDMVIIDTSAPIIEEDALQKAIEHNVTNFLFLYPEYSHTSKWFQKALGQEYAIINVSESDHAPDICLKDTPIAELISSQPFYSAYFERIPSTKEASIQARIDDRAICFFYKKYCFLPDISITNKHNLPELLKPLSKSFPVYTHTINVTITKAGSIYKVPEFECELDEKEYQAILYLKTYQNDAKKLNNKSLQSYVENTLSITIENFRDVIYGINQKIPELITPRKYRLNSITYEIMFK